MDWFGILVFCLKGCFSLMVWICFIKTWWWTPTMYANVQKCICCVRKFTNNSIPHGPIWWFSFFERQFFTWYPVSVRSKSNDGTRRRWILKVNNSSLVFLVSMINWHMRCYWYPIMKTECALGNCQRIMQKTFF